MFIWTFLLRITHYHFPKCCRFLLNHHVCIVKKWDERALTGYVWLTVVNTIMNLRFPYNEGNFLSSGGTQPPVVNHLVWLLVTCSRESARKLAAHFYHYAPQLCAVNQIWCLATSITTYDLCASRQFCRLCYIITQLCLLYFVDTVILSSLLLCFVSCLIPFDFVVFVWWVEPYYNAPSSIMRVRVVLQACEWYQHYRVSVVCPRLCNSDTSF